MIKLMLEKMCELIDTRYHLKWFKLSQALLLVY